MKPADIQHTIIIAERLIDLAAARLAEIKNDRASEYTGTKLSGALRRASMELTRALAEMRKA